ncbi:hypothetical protein [Aquimarina intermedia]|uniref:Uncharacterized protein n=1 Tax=Aquimarina intermedia TaxID=350814 RepID=A0A5S5C3F5_9FLAO|nr:hypothetical protein [Aquimarina intermedia]TYP73659.1 hypothetical protein BD809_105250 [Aquimarina intermedia]
MRLILIFLIGIIILGCVDQSKSKTVNQTKVANDSDDPRKNPCPEEWNLNGPTDEPRNVVPKQLNDSTTQQLLFGKVWFEIINPTELENGVTKCYLKNYRTDGSLESEGFGIYDEHPVADYSMEGKWRFYSCDGKLKEEVKFVKGKRIKK